MSYEQRNERDHLVAQQIGRRLALPHQVGKVVGQINNCDPVKAALGGVGGREAVHDVEDRSAVVGPADLEL